MKDYRIISLILCGALIATLASCGGGGTSIVPPASSPVSSHTASAAPAPSASAPTSAGVQVDEGLLSVDLTLPASLFEGQDMSTFDTDAYAKEQGFIKAVINEDGSITVTMTKAKHEELLTTMSAQVEQGFIEMIGSADYPYIKDITYTENFKTITAIVDRPEYEAVTINLTPFALGMAGMMYQVFTGDKAHVEIVIQDEATGDIVTSFVYPDDMGGTN